MSTSAQNDLAPDTSVTRELIDALDREEIAEARTMDPATKMALGGVLFEDMVRRMEDGIRHRHPDFDDAQVRAMLREWLDRYDELEAGD